MPGCQVGRVVQLRTVRQLALNLLGQGGRGTVMSVVRTEHSLKFIAWTGEIRRRRKRNPVIRFATAGSEAVILMMPALQGELLSDAVRHQFNKYSCIIKRSPTA
ncbi:hypothetical protein MPL3365_170122 [Mesorhizobium plurifarium]|uniref:Uncharacterized protein n=1 Tax=Mesorhizobium plurifarium TaxID=69974 RepID=A0A090G5K9_MESPL|nr:hypothetical protein MPL3365_170122 [Mesorhizobium plurifarium]